MAHTGADEIQGPSVARRALGDQSAQFHFTHRRRHAERACAKFSRNFIEQIVYRLHADEFQHAGNIIGSMRNERHFQWLPWASSAKYFA
jgi:hypothetical protein